MSSYNRQSRATRPKRRGATTVEFALIVVPMFTLVFACIEFSRVAMIESMAEDAAYAAGRHVIVAGAKKAEAVAEANRLLALLGTRDVDVVVTPYDETTEQNEIDDNTDEVKVEITIPISSNTLFISRFTGDVVITKTSTMKTERYKGYYDGASS